MGEVFTAAAGMAASLDASARADVWDGKEHRMAATYQHPDLYAVCLCGTRIDAVDALQLDRLFVKHRQDALAGDQAAGLSKARASLAEAVDRKKSA